LAFDALIILAIAILILLAVLPILLGAIIITLLVFAWPLLLALGIALLIGILAGAISFEASTTDGYSLRIHIKDPFLLAVIFIIVVVLFAITPLLLLPTHHPALHTTWR